MNILDNSTFLTKAHATFDKPLSQLEIDIYALAAHNRKVYAGMLSLYMGNFKPNKRYNGHFHVINKHNVAMTIELTGENVLSVCGKKFNDLNRLLQFAENIQQVTKVA